MNIAQYILTEQLYCGISEKRPRELELLVSCFHNHSAKI